LEGKTGKMSSSTARISAVESKALSAFTAGEQGTLFDLKQKLSLIDGRLRPLLLRRDKAKIALHLAKQDGNSDRVDALMRDLSQYSKEVNELQAKRDALTKQSRQMTKKFEMCGKRSKV
jgi:hypothetical protein